MDRESENSHPSRTPIVVEVKVRVSHLGIIAKIVPSKVEGAIGLRGRSGWFRKVRRTIWVLVGGLHHGAGGDHLGPGHTGDGVQRFRAMRKAR